MRTTQILGLGLLAFFGYSFLRKGQAISKFYYHPTEPRALKWDHGAPVLVLGLAIQNTSNQSFIIKSLAGEVYCDNAYIGNASSFVATEILPNSEKIIEINLRMSLIGIVSEIIRAFTDKDFKKKLELDAYANIDNIQIPINVDYTIGK